MQGLRSRFVVALALAAVSACAGESTEQPHLASATVEVLGVWEDVEQERFEQVLDRLERRTGMTVRFTSTEGEDIAAVLARRRRTHDLPEVALLPQPGLLQQYAADGLLVPLEPEVAAEVGARYGEEWRRLASVGSDVYGIWFKAANKSLVWYRIGVFERLGLVPPSDLGGLVRLADGVAAGGVTPFAVSSADPWTLTDWFENVYLAVAGSEGYDALAERRRAWTHPTVERSLRLLEGLLAPERIAGGRPGAAAMTFTQSVATVFGQRPRAAMVLEGDFVAGAIDARTDAQLGVDADAFAFPQGPTGRPGVVGGGDVAVLFDGGAPARAVVDYLGTAEAGETWAELGGFLSPNEDVALEAYPDPLTRRLARMLLEAGDGFRFDLSDLQPADFGATTGSGMFAALAELVAGVSDPSEAARRLEASADAAYREVSGG